MISLKGHSALITGSTAGIGRAMAESLALAGASIVLHGLAYDDAAKEAIATIEGYGVQTQFISGDLSGPTAEVVEQLYQSAMNANPRIDILISNAGTYNEPDFLEVDYATFEKTMRLNVFSHFFLIQKFASKWVQDKVQGRVLLTGSINGRLAEPTHSVYDTSKGAVEAMVKTLCVSLAPHGIRVNGLAPGLFRTPLTAAALDQPGTTEWMKLHTPNGNVPGPEACGPLAAFLVSDLASHIHGQMHLVDGGMSAWQQPDPPDSFLSLYQS